MQYAIKEDCRETSGHIVKILQKGWPRAYRHACSSKRPEVENYLTELKSSIPEDAALYCAEIFIFYSLCLMFRANVIKPKEMMEFIQSLALRSYIHANDKHFDIYGKMGETARKRVDDLEARIFSDYVIEIKSDNHFITNNKELARLHRFYSRLAHTEKVILHYLLKDTELDQRDIKDVLGVYVTEYGDKCGIDAAKLFLSGIIVKLLLKTVMQLKEQFSQHSGEQKAYEAAKYEKTIDRLVDENKQLEAENRSLKETISRLTEKLRLSSIESEKQHQDKIRELEKEIAKQDEAIMQWQEKERELAALRDFLFSFENRDAEPEPDVAPETLMDLKDTTGAIIGGSERWVARMKEFLPKWVFISSPRFDKRSLEGVQTVCFCPKYMGHTLYYKAIAIAQNRNMDIGYIYSQNEHLALKEIAKVLVKLQ